MEIKTLLAGLMLVMAVGSAQGLNVLISPVNLGSHIMFFGRIGEELVKRGHKVTLVTGSTMSLPSAVKKYGMDVITYHMDEGPFFPSERHSKMIIENALTEDPYMNIKIFTAEAEAEVNECHALLKDKELYSKLKTKNFDIAIVDILPCMDVMPYKLGIPFTHAGAMCPSQYFRQPDLPSFVPRTFHDVGYTDNMSFSERLQNTFNFVMELLFVALQDDDFVGQYVPERPHLSMGEIMRKPSFCFLTKPPILDFPQPLMPNIAFIEVMARDAKPVTDKDLLKFADSATHGLVICSFGTLVSHMPQETAQKFLEAFSLVKQHVIWRYTGEPPANLPDNIRLSKWLPQNDLLGHPNTKLLIMHGGFSSLVEAVHHGVPMVVMPFFADQKYVAKVISHKGYGLQASMARFTPQELAQTITDVVYDKSFYATMKKASLIFRDKLNPSGDVVEYWLKHIVKFGDAHLRSHALEMPLYSYFMLDIIAFFIGILIIILCLLWFVCILLRGCLCRKKSSKTKTD